MDDNDLFDAGELRLLAALGLGPRPAPGLRAQLAAELDDHLRTFTAADTAEDIRAGTDLLARDVYRRHGQPGVDELRRLTGEW